MLLTVQRRAELKISYNRPQTSLKIHRDLRLMSSAIKCPRCKQRISVSENERLLVCPMCKTQLDLPEAASGSVPPVIQPRMEPSSQSATPIAPQVSASQPFANQANQVNANQGEQSFGDEKQPGFADTHFDAPGSGSSFFFVLFIVVAMFLFVAIFGVLVWLLTRAL